MKTIFIKNIKSDHFYEVAQFLQFLIWQNQTTCRNQRKDHTCYRWWLYITRSQWNAAISFSHEVQIWQWSWRIKLCLGKGKFQLLLLKLRFPIKNFEINQNLLISQVTCFFTNIFILVTPKYVYLILSHDIQDQKCFTQLFHLHKFKHFSFSPTKSIYHFINYQFYRATLNYESKQQKLKKIQWLQFGLIHLVRLFHVV